MTEGQDVNEPKFEHHKIRKVIDDAATRINSHSPSLEKTVLPNDDNSGSEDAKSEDSKADTTMQEQQAKRIGDLRTWQWTALGQELRSCKVDGRTVGLELTLMCYNVLSQELIEVNRYLYNHCKSPSLKWKHRKVNLLAEIKAINADIICLQEVQEDHYEEVFQPEMKLLGYDGMYKKRTGDKNDGCSFFYKTDVFTLEKRVDIEYFQPGIRVLDRDNVGLLAVLKPHAEPSVKLCVATTHLLFNPRRGDIKMAQLQVLLAELDKAAFKGVSDQGKHLYHPCIVCGDMNSEPFSPLYNFLTRGYLHYEGMYSGDISGQWEGRNRGRTVYRYDILLPELGITRNCQYASELKSRDAEIQEPLSSVPLLEHGFRFNSSYSHTNPDGTFEVTTHHMKANCTVDYILYSVQNFNNNALRLLGTMRLLSDHEVEDIGGLPNFAVSSDHLSLVAKFLLKKPEID